MEKRFRFTTRYRDIPCASMAFTVMAETPEAAVEKLNAWVAEPHNDCFTVEDDEDSPISEMEIFFPCPYDHPFTVENIVLLDRLTDEELEEISYLSECSDDRWEKAGKELIAARKG